MATCRCNQILLWTTSIRSPQHTQWLRLNVEPNERKMMKKKQRQQSKHCRFGLVQSYLLLHTRMSISHNYMQRIRFKRPVESIRLHALVFEYDGILLDIGRYCYCLYRTLKT